MANINQRIDLSRRYFKDSGYLTLSNNSQILSNGFLTFILDERFKPYDDSILVNLDNDNDVEVKINYSVTEILPRGNQLKPSIPISEITIKNIGSTTIAANNIRLYYRNTGYKGKEQLQYLSNAANIGTFLNTFKGWFNK